MTDTERLDKLEAWLRKDENTDLYTVDSTGPSVTIVLDTGPSVYTGKTLREVLDQCPAPDAAD